MKNLLLSTLLLFLATACTLKPTNKHDIFQAQARLPQEEAPHLQNSLEWWYFTGHLRDKATGEVYGVEYVFFHFNPTGKKDWQMVNFALTDPQKKQFRFDYKLESLPQLLPATLPLNLSMEKKAQKWRLTGQEGSYHLQARMADAAGQAINLITTPAKPVLLHGGTGYEQYGPVAKAGYYSYTRLATAGTIEIDGKQRQVEGELWYDRQWNCNSVMAKDSGWDWLSIQLDEPRAEIMAYQLRNNITGESLSGGSHYSAQNQNTHLAGTDFQLEPLEYWVSPRSKQRYPIKWRLRIPSQGYDLVIEPVLPNQELNLRLFKAINLHYWEGMCKVTGTHNGKTVTGNSYVEITNPGTPGAQRGSASAVAK
jgi:predicted secreted hydrolase